MSPYSHSGRVVCAIPSLPCGDGSEGASAMAGNITTELIGKVGVKNLTKGVKVQVTGNTVKADLRCLWNTATTFRKPAQRCRKR